MERATILCLDAQSPSWPRELDEIEGKPERIWLRGDPTLLARMPRIAVVGTRSPTPYGEAQARRFARAFSAAGMCVVSGLARGIDQAAHAAVLDQGGATIAILGNGVDRPWPAGPLTERVARDGLLMSEFMPGTSPRPHHFPLRNRLISGLCRGVLVVEAAAASGSLITARWAADQGRSVWAIPGRVDHPLARGSHKLIREGAELVEDPEEIVREILGAQAVGTGEVATSLDPPVGLGAELVELLRGETLDADELASRARQPLPLVLVALIELELAGHAVRGPGGMWRRLDT